ncbi:MAG TPA: response regulator transcription factor [Conexibacter sp.]
MIPAAPRTVIVDDHALFRAGLRELLEEAAIPVLGEASTAGDGVRLVEHHRPDVAVVDLGLPDMSGVEAIRLISERSPRTAVLVVTVSDAEADLTDAILAGGRGYLLKETAVDTLASGVRAVAAGEAVLSPRVAASLMTRIRTEGRSAPGMPPADELSAREREVLRLVAGGASNSAIAAELFISPHTVKNHISTILVKLQVANRIQAAVRAVRDDLV